MVYRPDYYKLQTGKTKKELLQRPNRDRQLKNYISGLNSSYPLLTLGRSVNGDETISEEERGVNFHILGGSGEGKSKFIENLIRHDIDNGNGLCLIDPSDYGSTSESILRYCALNGHRKVVYITPDSLVRYKKIPVIQPLNPRYLHQSVSGVI